MMDAEEERITVAALLEEGGGTREKGRVSQLVFCTGSEFDASVGVSDTDLEASGGRAGGGARGTAGGRGGVEAGEHSLGLPGDLVSLTNMDSVKSRTLSQFEEEMQDEYPDEIECQLIQKNVLINGEVQTIDFIMCNQCPRLFRTENLLWNHIKGKHKRRSYRRSSISPAKKPSSKSPNGLAGLHQPRSHRKLEPVQLEPGELEPQFVPFVVGPSDASLDSDHGLEDVDDMKMLIHPVVDFSEALEPRADRGVKRKLAPGEEEEEEQGWGDVLPNIDSTLKQEILQDWEQSVCDPEQQMTVQNSSLEPRNTNIFTGPSPAFRLHRHLFSTNGRKDKIFVIGVEKGGEPSESIARGENSPPSKQTGGERINFTPTLHKPVLNKKRRKLRTGLQSFMCEFCFSSGFPTKKVLENHLKKIHQAGAVECDECGKRVLDLKRHREVSHRKFRVYDCSHCEGTFCTQEDLDRHLRNVEDRNRVERGGTIRGVLPPPETTLQVKPVAEVGGKDGVEEEQQGEKPDNEVEDKEVAEFVKQLESRTFSCSECGLRTPSRMTYIQHVLTGCIMDKALGTEEARARNRKYVTSLVEQSKLEANQRNHSLALSGGTGQNNHKQHQSGGTCPDSYKQHQPGGSGHDNHKQHQPGGTGQNNHKQHLLQQRTIQHHHNITDKKAGHAGVRLESNTAGKVDSQDSQQQVLICHGENSQQGYSGDADSQQLQQDSASNGDSQQQQDSASNGDSQQQQASASNGDSQQLQQDSACNGDSQQQQASAINGDSQQQQDSASNGDSQQQQASASYGDNKQQQASAINGDSQQQQASASYGDSQQQHEYETNSQLENDGAMVVSHQQENDGEAVSQHQQYDGEAISHQQEHHGEAVSHQQEYDGNGDNQAEEFDGIVHGDGPGYESIDDSHRDPLNGAIHHVELSTAVEDAGVGDDGTAAAGSRLGDEADSGLLVAS